MPGMGAGNPATGNTRAVNAGVGNGSRKLQMLGLDMLESGMGAEEWEWQWRARNAGPGRKSEAGNVRARREQGAGNTKAKFHLEFPVPLFSPQVRGGSTLRQ